MPPLFPLIDATVGADRYHRLFFVTLPPLLIMPMRCGFPSSRCCLPPRSNRTVSPAGRPLTSTRPWRPALRQKKNQSMFVQPRVVGRHGAAASEATAAMMQETGGRGRATTLMREARRVGLAKLPNVGPMATSGSVAPPRRRQAQMRMPFR